jgi:predicted GNAT superfamily acetyltransferase
MCDDITIRKAESPSDYRAVQVAQRRAWGILDDNYIVPIATMVGAQWHGGLVLGAFLPDGQAVGVSFGFLGRIGGRLGLYSQLTGVVPTHQSAGIGYRLKIAQREWARAEGLACIAWAFDPLQAGNARFNLDRLGAKAVSYVVDMYGPRTDALNAGVATDRLLAEWETDGAPHVPIDPSDALRLPRLVEASGGPGAILSDSAANAPAALLEIPGEISRLRKETPELALRWQETVRRGFLEAFAGGHKAVGLLRVESQAGWRNFYVLKREPRSQAPSES